MSKYNHMLDIAFTVTSDSEDPESISREEIIASLLRRIADLTEFEHATELRVGCAIGHCDTFEEEKE